MFIGASKRSVSREGAQWARGNFLICALPATRDEAWCQARDLARKAAQAKAVLAGRDPGFWGDYLSAEEKALKYTEWLYHPPFTEMRCFVRNIYLRQMGHWMMGSTTLSGLEVSLSGTYGEDGLPKTLPREVWQTGMPLPEGLALAWAKGEGGHNCAGSEGPSIHDWAADNIKSLKKAGVTR